MALSQSEKHPRKQLSAELDHLEAKIAELRIQYEQHFVDVVPQPPTKMHKEVVREIRRLLRAPFKNSADRFRLRMIVQRFQVYHTYWERVNKQREDGTYTRDLFKADLRERLMKEAELDASKAGKAEQGLRQLYSTYEAAVRKTGGAAGTLNFDAFKKNLMKKAKELKAQHGVKKLHYKIAVKGGKVVIKASAKS